GMHEHYCRRWNAVHLLATLARGNGADPAAAPHVAVQRARFITSGESYFLLTLARPLALTPGTNTSVTLGFKIDNRFKSVVKFWDDEQIP
ncbi:MAG: XRE family transcriptional regulator, partial [Gammaproteobacteria bacterium]|nr:XRE family transcriptional regulator [Gammaproteobacteria bacterium]NIY31805.1 XRE family transcriptional regulator [Gammaproteobacteria bacterium]